MKNRLLTLAAVVLAGACQDYNFNPVGHCIVQPGSTRITLSNLSTADVLFIVDDSGSMLGEQQNLAANFGTFIKTLSDTNVARVNKGLDPLDFHIAVTNSSVFRNNTNFLTCKKDGTGALKCCDAGNNCTAQDCLTEGKSCGNYSTNYIVQNCAMPSQMFKDGDPYPAGHFIAKPGNAKVLHFTKDLYCAPGSNPCKLQLDSAKINALQQQFQDNATPGTCGSGEEQHLQAAYLAVDKALGGEQPDANGEWPHQGAKLVVVWMGDEDDCSNTADPLKALVLEQDPNYGDSCMADEALAVPQQKHVPLKTYDDYFHSLGRSFGAAFIVSTKDGTCNYNDNGATCQAGICACQTTPGPDCGGQSQGNRFIQLANLFRQRGDQVVVGSICDASFSKTLENIAHIVEPPNALTLPTPPASKDIIVLRIVGADGKQRLVCNGPGTAKPDWYFTLGDANNTPSTEPTKFIFIDHTTNHCEANPGETYSAEYLGSVASCAKADDCAKSLGGTSGDWICDVPSGKTVGTCLCKSQQ